MVRKSHALRMTVVVGVEVCVDDWTTHGAAFRIKLWGMRPSKHECVAPGCTRIAESQYCKMHRKRIARRGTIELPTVETRFWSKVDINGPVPVHQAWLGPCAVWTAGATSEGYGQFRPGGLSASIPAHRMAWMLATGDDLSSEQLVCHRCDNPSCVRFDHLFIGTPRDNSADMVAKGRQAVGDHVPPERRARGERSGQRLHPERTVRGVDQKAAKLTEADVLAIVSEYGEGGVTQAQLGAKYGISQTGICLIVRGLSWKHVTSSRG